MAIVNAKQVEDVRKVPRFRSYLRLEGKIIRRYLHPEWMVVLLVGIILVWYWVEPDSPLIEYMNVALLTDFFLVSILGMYFQDFFWAGDDEPFFRFALPVDLRLTIRAKNLLILGVLLGSVAVVSGVLAVVFRPAPVQLLNGTLFILSVAFPLLHFGNMNTIRMRRKYGRSEGLSILVRNGLAFVGASLPYVVFRVVLGSVFLCLTFSVLAAAGWYLYSIPRTARLLSANKFELLEGS